MNKCIDSKCSFSIQIAYNHYYENHIPQALPQKEIKSRGFYIHHNRILGLYTIPQNTSSHLEFKIILYKAITLHPFVDVALEAALHVTDQLSISLSQLVDCKSKS